MIFSKKNLAQITPLMIAVLGFVSFGLFHLTQFETTDEHFWKYDRIQKYYNGIYDGITKNDWKKTRINDKPGVTVALLSGIGLPFSPDPQEHRNIELEEATRYTDAKSGKSIKLYDIFFTQKTEQINRALRLPILLFNALVILPLLFYLLWHAFSPRIAQISILLIGLNPILIGISQIPNPDALLWSTSAIAIISFYALLAKKGKKYIFICGVATGLALLSKYTANLLFVFYPIIFILHSFFVEKEINKRSYIISILSIIGISWTIFIALMPAVIQKPAHFLYGTVYSPVLSSFVDPFISATHSQDLFFTHNDDYKTISLFVLAATLFVFLTIIFPLCSVWLTNHYKKATRFLLKMLPIFYLIIVCISLINAWSDASIFSLENIKESSQDLESLSFPQITQYMEPLRTLLALTIQMQNILFTLHPIIFAATIFVATALIINKKIPYQHMLYLPFIGAAIFIVGGIFSNIFVNVRYSIMLYVPCAILAAIAIIYISEAVLQKYPHHQKSEQFLFKIILVIIILLQSISLITIAPHFFNYESFLLPKKHTVVDSWGYGVYEAATYLNTLPDAKDLIVWSDRDGLCQFFIGKCISPGKIDLDHTDVDYFVFTRRGIIRKPFSITSSDETYTMDRDYYYSEEALSNPQWQLFINNRPDNFIKIIKVKK